MRSKLCSQPLLPAQSTNRPPTIPAPPSNYCPARPCTPLPATSAPWSIECWQSVYSSSAAVASLFRPDIVDEARALKLIDPAVAFGGKLDLDAQIAVLRAEHATDRTAVDRRLALLERSPWRKLVDWCNTLKRAWFEHSPPTH